MAKKQTIKDQISTTNTKNDKAVFSEKVSGLTFVLGDKARNSTPEIFMDHQQSIPESSTILFLKKYVRNKVGMVGFVILVFMVLLALIGPLIWTDYASIDMTQRDQPWSKEHIFGTDAYGRDIWARLLVGLRFSLGLAAIATLIDLIVGVGLGIWMGYSKTADKVIMFVIKVMSNIPSTIILILLVIVIRPSFWIIVFALTITGWMGMAIQVRAQVLRLAEQDWVTASKVLGVPEKNIIASFVPVILPIIITQLVFTIPGVILSEASLGFIGLSIPNEPTLGNMIADSQEKFMRYPNQLIVPSMFLMIIVLSVQLIGNAVQEILKATR